MLDVGANTVCTTRELADEVSFSYTKEKGFVKGFNARSLTIEGVARGALIQISRWYGKVDITSTPLDGKKFYLGIDFLDMVKAFLVPYTNNICIIER